MMSFIIWPCSGSHFLPRRPLDKAFTVFRGLRQNSSKAAERRRAIVFIASHRVMLGAAVLPLGVPSSGHFSGTAMPCSNPILHMMLVTDHMTGGHDMDTRSILGSCGQTESSTALTANHLLIRINEFIPLILRLLSYSQS